MVFEQKMDTFFSVAKEKIDNTWFGFTVQHNATFYLFLFWALRFVENCFRRKGLLFFLENFLLQFENTSRHKL